MSVTTAMLVCGQLVGSLSIGKLVSVCGVRAICPYMTGLSVVGGLYCLVVLEYGENDTTSDKIIDSREEETVSVLVHSNE